MCKAYISVTITIYFELAKEFLMSQKQTMKGKWNIHHMSLTYHKHAHCADCFQTAINIYASTSMSENAFSTRGTPVHRFLSLGFHCLREKNRLVQLAMEKAFIMHEPIERLKGRIQQQHSCISSDGKLFVNFFS